MPSRGSGPKPKIRAGDGGEPQRDRANEDHVRIGERRSERAALPAHGGVQPGTAEQRRQREHDAEDHGEHGGMQGQRGRIRAATRADGAGDRRGDAAAESAIGHHLHQHQDREDQRDAGECLGAEKAHEVGFDDADHRLHDDDHQGRQRQPHGRCADRAVQDAFHAGTARPLRDRGGPQRSRLRHLLVTRQSQRFASGRPCHVEYLHMR
jgi:hypothetical protein